MPFYNILSFIFLIPIFNPNHLAQAKEHDALHFTTLVIYVCVTSKALNQFNPLVQVLKMY